MPQIILITKLRKLFILYDLRAGKPNLKYYLLNVNKKLVKGMSFWLRGTLHSFFVVFIFYSFSL